MERAERMVIAAIDAHPAFDGYRSSIKVYAKGSYANKTNVRADSDVTSWSKTSMSSTSTTSRATLPHHLTPAPTRTPAPGTPPTGAKRSGSRW